VKGCLPAPLLASSAGGRLANRWIEQIPASRGKRRLRRFVGMDDVHACAAASQPVECRIERRDAKRWYARWDSGERRAFDRSSGVDLVDAVTASGAVPGGRDIGKRKFRLAARHQFATGSAE
jgi:hypothetical protein